MDYEDYTDVPRDVFYDAQNTWTNELTAAHKEQEHFHERGDRILEFYTDSRKTRRTKRYPLFNANVSILENALFARIPRPDVSRRFKDPDDHIGRVASLILSRALTTEIEGTDDFKTNAKALIKDMLVVGMGAGWVRYEEEAGEEVQITDDENAELSEFEDASPIAKDQRTPIDYVHWKDLRWSPCRVWTENRWVGRRVYMDEETAQERFGERAEWLSYSTKPFANSTSMYSNSGNPNEPENTTEPQAEIWEIWDKPTKKVYWICETCPTALDIKDDFLGLPDFFPTDRPLVANISTSSFIPTADYTQLQDQYNDLNETNNRISRLVKACRLAGVYDESQPGVKLLLEGAAEHQLVPIKNYSAWAEKGGLKGAIDFLPLQEIVTVIAQLTAHREVLKQQIYELTGISDIVRGASNPYETAAAQGMKAQYASIRLQGKQSDVAEYLTGLMQRKAFLMLKFYTPDRLMERCGVLSQADQQYIQPALQLLQNELLTSLKLTISSDSLQQPNWAKDQQDKTQTVTALSQLLAPVMQQPGVMEALAPLYAHIVKWAISGSPGAREIEGELEAGLQQLMQSKQQQAQTPKPDPAAEAAKAQMQLEQQKAQAANQLAQQELQAKSRQAQAELQLKREIAQQELQLKQQASGAELQSKERIEMTKASAKQTPQYVHGNTGMDEEQVLQAVQALQSQTLQAIGAMQHSTIEAITALANQPQEPQQVRVSRDANGDLVGVIA